MRRWDQRATRLRLNIDLFRNERTLVFGLGGSGDGDGDGGRGDVLGVIAGLEFVCKYV